MIVTSITNKEGEEWVDGVLILLLIIIEDILNPSTPNTGSTDKTIPQPSNNPSSHTNQTTHPLDKHVIQLNL